ncbi:DUF4271 domain-containing protein [Pedobacter boryungensis]|uniref:DUF4271 domain-containing protein n=1 Tax=Pedobacter boryungensis TaxID=869962 RepID=A0ABX2DEI5_9SPHI|nr:DUF4271 domain-containing protein [Pedobacter boryungensis]NQX31974.1 DUF4271 domain-containing protein [Pedobacter boryungensis]
MFKKVFLLNLLFFSSLLLSIKAQQLPLTADSISNITVVTDSLDSTQNVVVAEDTITPHSLRALDSLTKALIADSLKKSFSYPKLDFKVLMENFLRNSVNSDPRQQGDILVKGDIWILAFIAFLLVLFAILKNVFSKQLMGIILSFFSNRALGNLNKEDNLFTSWPFLLLFVQFGFTIGMFFYLVAQYQKLDYVRNGFQFFVTISVVIIVLYVLKILLLRVLGYIFNIQKPVHEYVSILYLSYFNASLLFTPLVIAFALSPIKYGSFYIATAIILIVVIFVFQFIRAGVNILSHYRFSKVYLFLYFCTLEICPILILIKAIGF